MAKLDHIPEHIQNSKRLCFALLIAACLALLAKALVS